MGKFQGIIFFFFALLFFFIPLILWPFTSEVFEFNKMVVTYILTVLITGAWAVRCIAEEKFIFRRTILDKPLLIFIASQLVATLLSIDPRTSLLGYYSRFNGGLLSTLCYALLYWAFVSNLDSKSALHTLYFVLTSATIVSIYGVLEHFGIDKNLWVQDVQNRVFSTLGQPNWLAAFLVALMPIGWAVTLEYKSGRAGVFKLILLHSFTLLLFTTLLFTKSRSGLLGFITADLIFWIGYFWLNKKINIKKWSPPFIICHLSFVILVLAIGTAWTPSIFGSKVSSIEPQVSSNAPALETGGTESGTIRKIVWKGAFEVWKHYPVFGTGVETFAYSYYKYRPAEHNLVSEWDFIYNKAHNEFLNIAANTGTFGFLSYLALIGFSIYQIFKSDSTLNFAFLSGYVSLLVTNFFGFSVVPTQLVLFLFPAFAVVLSESGIKNQESKISKLTSAQKTAILFTIILASYFLIQISRYWYSDTLYAKAKNLNSAGKPEEAITSLTKAIKNEPKEPLYHNEIAQSYVLLADKDAKNIDLAIGESQKAVNLAPANVNLKRSRFGIFVRLSIIDPKYLILGRAVLEDAITYAPTDAKLYYNLGLVYARTGEIDNALETMKKTVELKSNYKEARYAYALLLIDKKDYKTAKEQLEFILKNIDPNDSFAKQTLEGVK